MPLLFSGDYSQAQLLRVHRQALVLHRFYELLSDAIVDYRESGKHYLVLSLAAQAARVLGDERVSVTTVRLWHAQYHVGEGWFRADERGHYTRDLLVMEEDVKHKFTKWSLKMAKRDDLSVEAAQQFLNTVLLPSLEACTVYHQSLVWHVLTRAAVPVVNAVKNSGRVQHEDTHQSRYYLAVDAERQHLQRQVQAELL